ncbi:hypothetical protein GCM10009623_15620 [Nocardioides aestuarii]|uniref:DUF4175 domain-containing protein n=1 Tax=Nocardioides aestuarii TaxID=252231 RepID=A0ABW4TJT8_9ACTN
MNPNRIPSLLVAALAGLVATDLVGGVWAATSGVNTWAGAWGSTALLAAPAPMVAAQVLLTTIAVRGRRTGAVVAAGLLATACLVSVASGFFDGGLGNELLTGAMAAFQVVLLAVTFLVGVLAMLRAVTLARTPAPTIPAGA